MRNFPVSLVSLLCFLCLGSNAFADTATPPPSQPDLASQGRLMIQQGEDLIQQGKSLKDSSQRLLQQSEELTKQGVILRDNGQRLFQLSGAKPAVTEGRATVIESTTQTTTQTPAGSKPQQFLQKTGQYEQYVQQGQQLYKGVQQLLPAGK